MQIANLGSLPSPEARKHAVFHALLLIIAKIDGKAKSFSAGMHSLDDGKQNAVSIRTQTGGFRENDANNARESSLFYVR